MKKLFSEHIIPNGTNSGINFVHEFQKIEFDRDELETLKKAHRLLLSARSKLEEEISEDQIMYEDISIACNYLDNIIRKQ